MKGISSGPYWYSGGRWPNSLKGFWPTLDGGLEPIGILWFSGPMYTQKILLKVLFMINTAKLR